MLPHPNEPSIVNQTRDRQSPSYTYNPLPQSHSRRSSAQFQTSIPLQPLSPARPSTAQPSRLLPDFMDDYYEAPRVWHIGSRDLYPKYICRALLLVLVLILFVASLPILVLRYHERPPSDVVAGLKCKTCKVLCQEEGAWLCEKAGCKPQGTDYMKELIGCYPVQVPKGWANSDKVDSGRS